VRTSNYDAWSAQRTLPLVTRHLSVDAPLVLVARDDLIAAPLGGFERSLLDKLC